MVKSLLRQKRETVSENWVWELGPHGIVLLQIEALHSILSTIKKTKNCTAGGIVTWSLVEPEQGSEQNAVIASSEPPSGPKKHFPQMLEVQLY
jgi:hypothetical protein